MTARERLALVADARDCMGDESPAIENPNADENLAFRMRLSIRLAQLEKRLFLLESLPELAAAVARQNMREVYK